MFAVATEIILIFLLIVANGVFALAEIAVVSSRRARLQQRAEGGDRGAQVALELAREPTHFLSTVQIGITLVGILAGAFGGATLAEAIAARLEQSPRLAPYAEAIGLAVVVAGITYLSLVVGELLPKRLALTNPERMAARLALPMRLLSRLMAPAVRLLGVSTDVLLRLLGIRQAPDAPVTPEEIAILMEQGRTAGAIEAAEQDIAESALFLGERRVAGLLTPRVDLVWIDLNEPVEKICETVLASRHITFPAAHGSLDAVAGMLRGRDLLARLLRGEPVDWDTLLRPALFVPETLNVLELLQQFKQTGQHAALVIDEFGGVQGLVTLTDVLELLVGDLPAPGAPAEPAAVRRDDGSWLLDGRLSVPELRDTLALPPLPGEGRFDTLGGFAMAELGQVPVAGQSFEFGGWRFEVVDMDGRRVDKVLAAPLAEPAAG